MLMASKPEPSDVPTGTPKADPNTGKNRLLGKLRKWHSWGGVLMSLLILLVAITGFLLNHKDYLLHGQRKEGPTGLLTSTTHLDSLPISFERAMEIARGHFGDVPLEKIELKDEHGWLAYKVSRGHGQEVLVDARTGKASTKYGIALQAKGESTLNWAKIVDDLHTGKFFGSIGSLVVDLTSGTLVALTLSGIYLWGVPLLRKRQNARTRLAQAGKSPAPSKVLRMQHRPAARSKVAAND
jgi:uncharacterized iron-regulated membrane protein